MSDFTPEIRNASIWSGDSRRIAKGDACAVVLEKLGRVVPEDISDREEVQMGHRMQPVVARIFEEVHNERLKDLDIAMTHPQHEWMRSHFDYVSEDGKYLVECKNYNANMAQYYSDPEEYPVRVPPADYAQCLHEACVYGTEIVWLAVLFGGQRYRDFRLTFTPEEKEEWIKKLAEVWGNIKTNTIPQPSTPEQAREVWPQDNSHTIVASKAIEQLCYDLAQKKQVAKKLDEEIDIKQSAIMAYMNDHAALVDITGKTLATWKTSKSSKRFSAELFKTNMPDLYEKFVVEQIGSRRFLVK
jgi:predicted phage-related endonuclease